MDEFLNNLRSPNFILSVIVLSFLINLASSYFRDGIDKIGSMISTWWATRTAAQKAQREYELKCLIADPVGQVVYAQESLRERLFMVQDIVFVSALFISMYLINIRDDAHTFGRWKYLFLGPIAFFYTLWFGHMKKSNYLRNLVMEARAIDMKNKLTAVVTTTTKAIPKRPRIKK